MTGVLSPEGSVDAIINILESGPALDNVNDLADKFDAIDTEYSASGDWVLDDIAVYLRAPRLLYDQVPALVCVGVGVFQATPSTKERAWQIDLALELILRETTTDDSTHNPAELAAVKIQRAARGIVEVLLDNRKLAVSGANNVDWLFNFEVAFSETIEQESAFEKRAEIGLSAIVSI